MISNFLMAESRIKPSLAKAQGFKNCTFSRKENRKLSLFQSQSNGSWPSSCVGIVLLHEEVEKEKINLGKHSKSCMPVQPLSLM